MPESPLQLGRVGGFKDGIDLLREKPEENKVLYQYFQRWCYKAFTVANIYAHTR